jgi:hypothetical protein
MLRQTMMPAALLTAFAAPALAQEVARDRADLDAAAGRLIFQNVLLADPQAFSPRARASASGRPSRPEPPPAPAQAAAVVPSGDAAADRRELDAAAGRAGAPGDMLAERAREQPGAGRRNVRVILASPYDR